MSYSSFRDPYEEWFHEDAVVGLLATFLEENGWLIESKPSARTRERGIDIVASLEDKTLLVEAKGYPSQYYMDARKRGQAKPTPAASQAQQWFSHALLKAMRMAAQHSSSQIAMAFPNMPRYRTLYAEIRSQLTQISLHVYFVGQCGEVICDPIDETPLVRSGKSDLSVMSEKYKNLYDWMMMQSGHSIQLSFAQVKEILGFLPNSAYRWPAWWANDHSRRHAVWLHSGWKATELNLQERSTKFERI